MTQHVSPVAHQFDDMEQQHRAGTLGMWTFLASEVLLFGGLFISYTVMRVLHHDGFVVGSHHMSFVIGSVNTAILLTSSLMMALAVYSAEDCARRATIWFLVATIVLGIVFVCLKFYEYYQHYEEGLMPGSHFTFAGPHAMEVGLFFW
ncbi:MAG TPA: cytochrome c oxidase subunit 3, partial [Rhodothermales bacterium]|nr:cytochrome c oxidase subunit 3 [Rhodothermales bacterium]